MNIFKLFKKREEKVNVEFQPIILNDQEKKIFENIKNGPVKSKKVTVNKISRDRILPEDKSFLLPGGKQVYSIFELKEIIITMNSGEFNWMILSRKSDLKQWVADQFDAPVLAEQIINCQKKEEFVGYLNSFLNPSIEVIEEENIDSHFEQMLENLVERFNEVKDSIQEARKHGVNTFISQTKVMNIKAKIHFAEVNQDTGELAKISTKLDEIMQELKEETNARRAEA